MTEMTDRPTLPEGLTTRPLRRGDERAVYEVIAAQELADTGEVAIDESDLHADWSRPSHDLGARSIAVLDGDQIVGYVELSGADRADAAVHPSHRGRGIGTWLAHWVTDLGRSLGSSVVGMPVPQGSPGDRLLESLGWQVRWKSWVLRLPAGTQVPVRDLPEGYVVRQAGEDDLRAAHDVLEDAFLEWSDRPREAFEDFHASLTQRPNWAPWMLRVVTDAAGDVVGVAWVLLDDTGRTAYVDRLATRRDQRNRGIAQALLVDAFAAGRERGAEVFELATDTRTGALGLYEKVGMRPVSTWVNRAVRLA
jgi:GNAT superfamily N-acetyltransferase